MAFGAIGIQIDKIDFAVLASNTNCISVVKESNG
jgi:hypothetical protein